jgi:hypothetical protein
MRCLAIATQSPDQFDSQSQPVVDTLTKTVEATLDNHSSLGAVAKTVAPHEAEEGAIAGVRIGQLACLSDMGSPLVDFPGNPTGAPLAARSSVRITAADLRRSVVLMFEDACPRRPVILGLLEEAPARLDASHDASPPAANDSAHQDLALAIDPDCFSVEDDGRRLVVSAEQELVFRCGRSSITLTKAGKVLIRGAYLLSRSSGVNRIKGGSVQIN